MTAPTLLEQVNYLLSVFKLLGLRAEGHYFNHGYICYIRLEALRLYLVVRKASQAVGSCCLFIEEPLRISTHNYINKSTVEEVLSICTEAVLNGERL